MPTNFGHSNKTSLKKKGCQYFVLLHDALRWKCLLRWHFKESLWHYKNIIWHRNSQKKLYFLTRLQLFKKRMWSNANIRWQYFVPHAKIYNMACHCSICVSCCKAFVWKKFWGNRNNKISFKDCKRCAMKWNYWSIILIIHTVKVAIN